MKEKRKLNSTGRRDILKTIFSVSQAPQLLCFTKFNIVGMFSHIDIWNRKVNYRRGWYSCKHPLYFVHDHRCSFHFLFLLFFRLRIVIQIDSGISELQLRLFGFSGFLFSRHEAYGFFKLKYERTKCMCQLQRLKAEPLWFVFISQFSNGELSLVINYKCMHK